MVDVVLWHLYSLCQTQGVSLYMTCMFTYTIGQCSCIDVSVNICNVLFINNKVELKVSSECMRLVGGNGICSDSDRMTGYTYGSHEAPNFLLAIIPYETAGTQPRSTQNAWRPTKRRSKSTATPASSSLDPRTRAFTNALTLTFQQPP